MMQKKGDRYIINGIEVAIVDAPATKPTVVEVNPKKGMSGKAHVKIFGINKHGGGSMMITKPRGSGFEIVKLLAFNVITYLIDRIISGDIKQEDGEEIPVIPEECPTSMLKVEFVISDEK